MARPQVWAWSLLRDPRLFADTSRTIHRVPTAQFVHRRARFFDGRVTTVGVEHVGDPVSDLLELALLEATRRASRRTDTDAARHHRRARIVGHRVLVHGDVRLAE